jgi:hypothetical protein
VLWLVPGFFATFGALFALFPWTCVALAHQYRQGGGQLPTPGRLAREAGLVRGFGVALLLTAAGFVVLILAGFLG